MELFYRKFGNEGGQPLIILHGLFGISDNWVTFARRIAMEGFEVFVPDQRNHGQSPHSGNFNYLALTDDLFEFIDRSEEHTSELQSHSFISYAVFCLKKKRKKKQKQTKTKT